MQTDPAAQTPSELDTRNDPDVPRWYKWWQATAMVLIGGPLVVAIGGAFLWATYLLLMQSLRWLKTGEWLTVPAISAIGQYPVSDWHGVDKIVWWVLDLPLALVLVVISSGLFVTLIRLMEEAERSGKEWGDYARQKKRT